MGFDFENCLSFLIICWWIWFFIHFVGFVNTLWLTWGEYQNLDTKLTQYQTRVNCLGWINNNLILLNNLPNWNFQNVKEFANLAFLNCLGFVYFKESKSKIEFWALKMTLWVFWFLSFVIAVTFWAFWGRPPSLLRSKQTWTFAMTKWKQKTFLWDR